MRRRTAADLTFPETFALEVAGFDPEPFASWEAARDAWEANRSYLVERAIERRPGGRPVAFWIFDAERSDLLGDPDDWGSWDAAEAAQIAWLDEHGELRPEERRRMTRKLARLPRNTEAPR